MKEIHTACDDLQNSIRHCNPQAKALIEPAIAKINESNIALRKFENDLIQKISALTIPKAFSLEFNHEAYRNEIK